MIIFLRRGNCGRVGFYLAAPNILIDDPKDKIFAAFGDAQWKIKNGVANI
ncbi:MAG: hypothetical protein AB7U82_22655 [Blastocatellales bacterium]